MTSEDAPDTHGNEDADGDAGPVLPIRLVEAAGLEDALAALAPAEAAWARTNAFVGRLGQTLMLPDGAGGLAGVLFGWGDAVARRRDRFHLGDLARAAPPGTYRLEATLEPAAAEQAALGWLLGRYRFDKYKGADEEETVDLQAPDGVDGSRLVRIVEGIFLTRDLINIPANDLGPAALAATAERLAARHSANIEVTEGEALLAANFPLIHAVGRAGAEAPRLIEMSWGDESHPRVTLVGKGVCFDTGGLNLKSASSMGLMKKDMGGAATALGLAHMIMALGMPIRLRVLIPAVENAVSARAMRPGDVLRSRLGRTVEINNTDAEGRLILADALAYAAEAEPELLFDFATLTGAARVAMGPDVVPFYTDDEALAGALANAAARVADPLWRLPLWPGYDRMIEPDIADLDNAPGGGQAGSITAALFLKRFVGTVPWVHFDIYGWTPSARPGRPRGGECQAARAVLEVLAERYGRREDA